MDTKKQIILGAGIAGLGAWYADNDAEIYEANDFPGGLCAGFDIEDFHFDRAVHLSFTKDSFVKELFGSTEHHTYHPIPKSWYEDRWLKHPFQNNLFPLDTEIKVQAVKGFIERDSEKKCDNFKDWTISRYGQYLWDKFFEPYNKKYWCIDLSELDICWIGNRFYQPNIEEVLRGSYTDETPNTYYAPEMRYPKKGGYFAYIRSIADEAQKKEKLHLNKKAVEVDIRYHLVKFSDGSQAEYDRLYSSVPMDEFVKMFTNDSLPERVKTSFISSDHTGIVIVSFGLRRSSIKQMWFYIYDEDIMAARAYMPSAKSDSNVPRGMESIQFEIYFNSDDEIPEKDVCINNCIYALNKIGVCKEDDIVVSDYRVLDYGNVIFRHDTMKNVEDIRNWMTKHDIVPIGRFGRWEYLWSDQAFLSGYNAVMNDEVFYIYGIEELL